MNPAFAVTLSSSLLTGASSDAFGRDARYISAEVDEGLKKLQQSYVLGNADLFNELQCLAEECVKRDWDGYGAEPVNARTVNEAIRVLRSLPLGVPTPTLGAEPDGHITIEWHVSPRRTLSVSISPDGLHHFSALIGTSRHYGTEPFLGEFPQTIRDLVQRVRAT